MTTTSLRSDTESRCGGCSYRDTPYSEQLAAKESSVLSLLELATARQAGFAWEGIKASPKPLEYRNKMEYSFGSVCKDGPMALGFHARDSHYDIVSASSCNLADADFRAVCSLTEQYFTDSGLPYYHRSTHKGYLRHLLVRKGTVTGEILIALVTAPADAVDTRVDEVLSGYREALLHLKLDGHIAGILHVINGSVADKVLADEVHILYGRDYYYDKLMGLRFKITPFSFFQVNVGAAELLYTLARDYAGLIPGQTIYDLYCGTGTIAQVMAGAADQVIGVEIVEEAVRAARENAEANGLGNCSFIAGDVGKVLNDIHKRPDVVILDPPRDGVSSKALMKILEARPDRIVYISCKPASLARDLGPILRAGYAAERGRAVDMFPGTQHVETVVRLSLLYHGVTSPKPDAVLRTARS